MTPIISSGVTPRRKSDAAERRRREIDAGIRTCSRCGITKPRGAFHRQAGSPDGRNSMCASCRAKASYQKVL
jgi:hypothetical protein